MVSRLYDPADHFTDASKMVAICSDAKREVEEMHLSRYACYPQKLFLLLCRLAKSKNK